MAPTSDARVPIRTCVGCGRRRPQAELVRCVLVERDGAQYAVVDRQAPGRGAWLCGAGCLIAARKRGGFRRTWRTDVPEALLDELAGQLTN